MGVQNLASFCDGTLVCFDFSTVFKEGGGVGSEALSKSEIYCTQQLKLRLRSSSSSLLL